MGFWQITTGKNSLKMIFAISLTRAPHNYCAKVLSISVFYFGSLGRLFLLAVKKLIHFLFFSFLVYDISSVPKWIFCFSPNPSPNCQLTSLSDESDPQW